MQLVGDFSAIKVPLPPKRCSPERGMIKLLYLFIILEVN